MQNAEKSAEEERNKAMLINSELQAEIDKSKDFYESELNHIKTEFVERISMQETELSNWKSKFEKHSLDNKQKLFKFEADRVSKEKAIQAQFEKIIKEMAEQIQAANIQTTEAA